jgi:hypothetical protein
MNDVFGKFATEAPVAGKFVGVVGWWPDHAQRRPDSVI